MEQFALLTYRVGVGLQVEYHEVGYAREDLDRIQSLTPVATYRDLAAFHLPVYDELVFHQTIKLSTPDELVKAIWEHDTTIITTTAKHPLTVDTVGYNDFWKLIETTEGILLK